MARYDLNEVLKQREKQQTAADRAKSQAQAGWNKTNSIAAVTEDYRQKEPDETVALDDVSRVKVLSPGRQVFKRFVRNRLAVTGSVILIVMFLFSFIGPLFYPYGQKEIFYKYDKQKVNYALAKQNTAFNGYDIDPDVKLERSVVNAVNSNIKKMIAADQNFMAGVGKEGGYSLRKLGDGIYVLSAVELKQVATTGNGSVTIGTYSQVGKKIDYAVAPVEGLEEAVAAAVAAKQDTVTHEGVTYTLKRGKAKSYEITSELSGILYTGAAMDAGFETALTKAAEDLSPFFYNGKEYVLSKNGAQIGVYETGKYSDGKVYSLFTLDTMQVGQKVPEEFRTNALLAAYTDGSFEAGGEQYSIDTEDGNLVVRDAAGNEFAEFSSFSVRRYSGEDTMEYALKKEISGKIEDMLAAEEKTGTIRAAIPEQAEDGSYIKDENGQYVLDETDMKITQRLEGEYVINCDQINYVIDTYASPSAKHILGTDGDGFDMFARIMYGGRISQMVGFVVVIIETVLGVIMGGIAGYFGGWVDNLIMRLVDVFYCLPSLPIMIILGAMMDAIRLDTYKRLMVMMAVLGVLGWAGVARLVRGQILSLREQEFMVATEATGIRIKDRIFKHLIPNVMPQLIVTATMGLGSVILTESTLSFLGLGVKHPLATWGTIINSVSSASAIKHYAFIWIPVGMLICLTVIAFNFVGDGLRDAYDPKAKR